ncbi:MAG: energy-coupling factor transporter transmembrane component T family protein [Limnochordia bacterium]
MKQPLTGRFIPGDSPVHALDARAKLICLILLLAAVVSAGTVYGYGLILAVISVILLVAELPLHLAVGPAWRMWPFLSVIFIMNALFFTATDPLWSWWIFHISLAGVQQGIHVVTNVALIMIISNALTLTTAPLEITKALASLIKPLRLIGIPTDDVAMIISVAIRFVPTLLEEADMIKKAQIARGARFESKRLTEKAKSYLPLIVPIFIAAFRRADELALAMEARGYHGAGRRTQQRPAPLRLPDYAALMVCMTVSILQLALLR